MSYLFVFKCSALNVRMLISPTAVSVKHILLQGREQQYRAEAAGPWWGPYSAVDDSDASRWLECSLRSLATHTYAHTSKPVPQDSVTAPTLSSWLHANSHQEQPERLFPTLITAIHCYVFTVNSNSCRFLFSLFYSSNPTVHFSFRYCSLLYSFLCSFHPFMSSKLLL